MIGGVDALGDANGTRSDGRPGPPLTIEVNVVPAVRDAAVVHVEGTARLASGPTQAFSGWMSLLEVLEGMIAGATGTART
jgi:hypothetical protein